jgi:hypothetical protein
VPQTQKRTFTTARRRAFSLGPALFLRRFVRYSFFARLFNFLYYTTRARKKQAVFTPLCARFCVTFLVGLPCGVCASLFVVFDFDFLLLLNGF